MRLAELRSSVDALRAKGELTAEAATRILADAIVVQQDLSLVTTTTSTTAAPQPAPLPTPPAKPPHHHAHGPGPGPGPGG
jgi:hypothetical protein